MTVPAAPPATPSPVEISRSLHASLSALDRARGTIEDAVTTAMQAEVMVRRLGLREATGLIERDQAALPEARREQSESNEAFRQIRDKLTELCASIDAMKEEIVSLDTNFTQTQKIT